MDRHKLRSARRRQKKIQKWANILIANMFKVLRLLQREEVENTQHYAQIITTLQELTESQRDVVMRAYMHVANNHSGLLEGQIKELSLLGDMVLEILDKTADALLKMKEPEIEFIEMKNREIRRLIHEYDQNQIMRIQDNSSKTRLSILFYSYMWNCQKVGEHTLELLKIFQDPLQFKVGQESVV
jgi:Na+/phosphate symporter